MAGRLQWQLSGSANLRHVTDTTSDERVEQATRDWRLPGDGADGGPLLPTMATWLYTAAVLLLLPRQYASSLIAFTLGAALSATDWWQTRHQRAAKKAAAQPALAPDRGET